MSEIAYSCDKKFITSLCFCIICGLSSFVFPQLAVAQSSDASPVAIYAFDRCITAARLGQTMTEQDLANDIAEEFEGKIADTKIQIFLKEDHKCTIKLIKESYDPHKLRQLLEQRSTSRFEENVQSCRWSVTPQWATDVLICQLNGPPEPASWFSISVAILKKGDALFWLSPILIFNPDGTARLPKGQ